MVGTDKGIKKRSKSAHKGLDDEFVNGIPQTDRPEKVRFIRVRGFWNKIEEMLIDVWRCYAKKLNH